MRPSTISSHSLDNQIADLRAAVDAADAGEFASDEEVQAVFARYLSTESGTVPGAIEKPSDPTATG